jgi:hypothetical protein
LRICLWLFVARRSLQRLDMMFRNQLSLTLMALLPVGVLAPACSSSSHVASAGQMITCNTDPTTGAILRCEPGTGSGSGAGSGSSTCQDMDEDGDGEPHDEGDDGGADQNHDQNDDKGGHDSATGDRDGDGIPDDRDCDEHAGEDGDRQGGLPYDVRPQLGATTAPVIDAFTAGGGQPAQIVSVALDGSTWRLAELQAGTSFVVTQDDCNHVGNRGPGRDRVIVTWKTADQAQHSDHLDIRYCH